jgi:hypothetical protein
MFDHKIDMINEHFEKFLQFFCAFIFIIFNREREEQNFSYFHKENSCPLSPSIVCLFPSRLGLLFYFFGQKSCFGTKKGCF